MSQRQGHSEEIVMQEAQQLGETPLTAQNAILEASNALSLKKNKSPNHSSHYSLSTASSANSLTASIPNSQQSEEITSQYNSDYSSNPHPHKIIYFQSKMYDMREITDSKSNIFHQKEKVEEECKNLKDAKEKLQKQYEVDRAILEDYRKKSKESQGRYQKIVESYAHLEEKMKEKNQQIGDLKEKLKEKDQQIDNLKDKINENNRQMGDLEEKMSENNQQICALKKKSKQQSKQIQDLKLQLAALKQGGQYKAQTKYSPTVEKKQNQCLGYTQYQCSAQSEQKLEPSHTSSCEEAVKKLRQLQEAYQKQTYNTKRFQEKFLKAQQYSIYLQYKLKKICQCNHLIDSSFDLSEIEKNPQGKVQNP